MHCIYFIFNSRLYGEQARYFDAEIKPRIKHTNIGMLSMVNNGSNMHGSQVSAKLNIYVNNIIQWITYDSTFVWFNWKITWAM